jgi:hypothetical protein
MDPQPVEVHLSRRADRPLGTLPIAPLAGLHPFSGVEYLTFAVDWEIDGQPGNRTGYIGPEAPGLWGFPMYISSLPTPAQAATFAIKLEAKGGGETVKTWTGEASLDNGEHLLARVTLSGS